MDVKEPLLRSDWTIYRGGAVLFNGAEDAAVEDCEFDQMGGNAVFINNYNRRVTVRGCRLHDTGANGGGLCRRPEGRPQPAFRITGKNSELRTTIGTPGPQTDDYPADCLVEDCLIRGIGVVEKQATGVEISMAQGITVPRHCSIYDVPRAPASTSAMDAGAATSSSSATFSTPCTETGDHGSFNSWGRDRYWGLKDAPERRVAANPTALLDVVQAEHPSQQPLAVRSRLGRRPGRRLQSTTKSTTTSFSEAA